MFCTFCSLCSGSVKERIHADVSVAFTSSPPSSCVVWNSNSARRAYLGGWPLHLPQPFLFRLSDTHTYTHTHTHTHLQTHTHSLIQLLRHSFHNHAKPLGPTIQAGPNLTALVQSEGWKLKSGIDWPVATGAS